MGQYWKPVNLDKREYLHPHKLGTGLKLWEQLANSPGTGGALIILCAAMPEPRGGGDFEDRSEVAKRIIGRWAGDRIAFVGDYSQSDDIPGVNAEEIYRLCGPPEEGEDPADFYTDITDDVCKVIENELGGKFVGDGWRRFEQG